MRITRKELTELVEDEVANALLDINIQRLREGYVKSLDERTWGNWSVSSKEQKYEQLIADLVDLLACPSSSVEEDNAKRQCAEILRAHGVLS